MEITINRHGDTNVISIEGERGFHLGSTGMKEPDSETDNPIAVEALYYAIERIAALEATLERKGGTREDHE